MILHEFCGKLLYGMESYRSGHNELHSKCSCPLLGTWVRIPHSPLFKKSRNPRKFSIFKGIRLFLWVFVKCRYVPNKGFCYAFCHGFCHGKDWKKPTPFIHPQKFGSTPERNSLLSDWVVNVFALKIIDHPGHKENP